MGRSKSSSRWLAEHHSDEFVKKAQAQGYRSRAVFKLEELLEKDRLIKPGMTIVDLGAAPGGWSQLAKQKVGNNGLVVALDILDMEPIEGVSFICGDFTELSVYEQLLEEMGEEKADLVMSDMAPNMSGQKAVDQPKAMYLVELALDAARNMLKPGGGIVFKIFQGAGVDELMKDARSVFENVTIRKPKASRQRSSEFYMVATGFKG